MWIVRLALRRPYTFVVMAMLIAIMGVVSILRMPTDIFPEIDIPVISIVWNYAGLSPEEMELRIVNNIERGLTTTVNDIEHIESQSLQGVSVIKIFFQPGANIAISNAQVTAISQTFLKQLPPGTTPPLVMNYSASNVPIIQVALSSDTLSEQQLFDLGTNTIRPVLITVHGAQLSWPFGGKQRQVMIDIDLGKLYAWGLSPKDVTNTVSAQSLILPTGTAKIGANEYPISINSSPELISDIESLPIRTVNGKTVYIRDVANVRDGFAPQTSMVHVNGKKSVLQPVLKSGGQSTLDVVAGVKDKLPQAMSVAPKELKASLLFDQSLFVRAAVEGVVKEAAIAAALTGIMILLFLGSWRSTLIVVVSIPLSILVSIIILGALGQTLNVMTLGGMSLAVGILVDDATVEIENIHRNIGKRKPLVRAILDGAQEIAVPAFVSTLAICIVFVPVAFITGSARSLFLPLALAVVFAMLASYLLSRTLVPTMVRYLLAKEVEEHNLVHEGKAPEKGFFGRLFDRFNDGFDAFRTIYGRALAWSLGSRKFVIVGFLGTATLSMGLLPIIGQDFFPTVDAGLIKLHVRVPPGTRIEETEHRFAAIEETIQKVVPKSEIETMVDNMGVPISGINLSLSDGSLVSTADGEILIALKPEHGSTPEYVRALRKELARKYPDTVCYFVAPDISTQVLNFGIPAPIDVQIAGPIANQDKNAEIARSLVAKFSRIPGAVDVHVHQVTDVPDLRVNVDRTMADQVGLTQRDVANDLLTSLASSGQVSPSYFLDRKRGIQYLVAVQTPQYEVNSLDALAATPLSVPNGGATQLLSNVAQVTRGKSPANITHSDIMPTLDVFMNVDGADLGSVAAGIDKLVAAQRKDLPRGSTIKVRGQVESMQSSFRGLGYGLVFAIMLVYLLMVVNFQSWLDPFIILMALPGAIAGIVWMLFLSRTTLSVPALMGAIMSVGVATANSILMITFANEQRGFGRDSVQAALAAGMVRLRPVCMTALAMIIGMLPMSLGFGEGGEQNAPLGRAVIGGLLFATVATLFFVPVMYSLLRGKPPVDPPD